MLDRHCSTITPVGRWKVQSWQSWSAYCQLPAAAIHLSCVYFSWRYIKWHCSHFHLAPFCRSCLRCDESFHLPLTAGAKKEQQASPSQMYYIRIFTGVRWWIIASNINISCLHPWLITQYGTLIPAAYRRCCLKPDGLELPSSPSFVVSSYWLPLNWWKITSHSLK